MREALREYGPITALIVVAMVGYALYSINKDDIFNYSLDLIGERMMEMVSDPEHRASIAGMFGQFKERALANEISHEQVELMAANVLNLSQSRVKLTPEQAELVLNMAYVEPDTTLAALLLADSLPPLPVPDQVRLRTRPPGPPPAPRPGDRDREALGRRLQSLIAFDAAVKELANAATVDAEALAEHMQYASDKGLHVVLDEEMKKAMPPQAFEAFSRELKRLDEKRMVIHQRDLARRVRAERRRVSRELQSLEALQNRAQAHAQARASLEQLEVFKHLQAMGYRPTFRSDSSQGFGFSMGDTFDYDFEKEMDSDEVDKLLDGLEDTLDDELEEVEIRVEDAMEAAKTAEQLKEKQVRVGSEEQGGGSNDGNPTQLL